VEQVTTSTGLSPSDALSVVTDPSAWRALRPINGQAQRERELYASSPKKSQNPNLVDYKVSSK